MQWYNAEVFGWEPAKKDSNVDVSAIDEALNDDDDEGDEEDEDKQAPGWDEISFVERNPLNDDEQQDDDNLNDDSESNNQILPPSVCITSSVNIETLSLSLFVLGVTSSRQR